MGNSVQDRPHGNPGAKVIIPSVDEVLGRPFTDTELALAGRALARTTAEATAKVRILVTGSRHGFGCDPCLAMEEAMSAAGLGCGAVVELVHGDARGVDRQAAEWAASWCRPNKSFPAAWAMFGSRAGALRNQEMVDYCAAQPEPCVCLAFPCPKSRGTWDCVRRAKAAGIRVVVAKIREDDG